MPKLVAVFYHSLLYLGNPPALSMVALDIVSEQMRSLEQSGLAAAANEMIVGLNGGQESLDIARLLIPSKAKVVLHGLESRAENLTIVQIENWVKTHPDWYVLYFHAKSSTHSPGPVLESRTLWRRCMERHLIWNWKRCVSDLDSGFEIVGCHYMEPPATPPTQFIFAGNFWFAKSNYLATLPSIYERARIKESGIAAADSRYESEVWVMNGARRPVLKDYHGPGWNPSQVHTCQ